MPLLISAYPNAIIIYIYIYIRLFLHNAVRLRRRLCAVKGWPDLDPQEDPGPRVGRDLHSSGLHL